jgi:4-hydroxyphenylpyruvate dioxygenase
MATMLDATHKPPSPAQLTKLVGAAAFERVNPLSDKFTTRRFHHIELWCLDATWACSRFGCALGLKRAAKSDLSTGNTTFSSYAMGSDSGEISFVFTAPYTSPPIASNDENGAINSFLTSGFSAKTAIDFVVRHGTAVRAVAVEVDDARAAYDSCLAGGATSVAPPRHAQDALTGKTQVRCTVCVVEQL